MDVHAQEKLPENGPTAPMELPKRAAASSVVAAVLNHHHVVVQLMSRVKVAKVPEKVLQARRDSMQVNLGVHQFVL